IPASARAALISLLSLSTISAGAFQEAVPWAENALVQNPRNNSARRLLAASRGSLGHSDKAAALMREVLKIEPDLTISTLQARMSYADDRVWMTYSEGLRRAGLPES